jgi:hypothetical protein
MLTTLLLDVLKGSLEEIYLAEIHDSTFININNAFIKVNIMIQCICQMSLFELQMPFLSMLKSQMLKLLQDINVKVLEPLTIEYLCGYIEVVVYP